MGVLRDFEGRLERIVEGFFSKAFRSGVQPVELAKAVLKEMERNKTVGVKEVWVPNRYVIALSAEDRERFEHMEHALARELETVVVQGAKERGAGLVARPEVEFESKDGLGKGEFRIASELTEETGPPPKEETAAPSFTPSGPARLVVVEGDREVREFPLEGARAVIGRLPGSDIQITDPGASRRHAEIRKEGDEFVLVDLGSTNGTMLNNETIDEHPLAPGDRITVGHTVMEFRR